MKIRILGTSATILYIGKNFDVEEDLYLYVIEKLVSWNGTACYNEALDHCCGCHGDCGRVGRTKTSSLITLEREDCFRDLWRRSYRPPCSKRYLVVVSAVYKRQFIWHEEWDVWWNKSRKLTLNNVLIAHTWSVTARVYKCSGPWNFPRSTSKCRGGFLESFPMYDIWLKNYRSFWLEGFSTRGVRK